MKRIPSLAAESVDRDKQRRYYVNSIYNMWRIYDQPEVYTKWYDLCDAIGFNSVNMDSSWSSERPDGSYDWEILDAQMDIGIARGYTIWPRINCTLIRKASGEPQRPYWLTDEMLMCRPDGSTYSHSNGPIAAITHPLVFQKMVRFAGEFATHLESYLKSRGIRNNPMVCMPFSFTPTAEAEYFFDGELDHSPSAKAAFARWIRTRYQSLDALNQAWDTRFTNWDMPLLGNSHQTDRHLFYESQLQLLFDAVADAVHKASPRMRLGLQVGCVWDVPQRRMINISKMMRKVDWLLVADAHSYPTAFTMDILRANLPGKQLSNEIDGPGFGGTDEQRLKQGLTTWQHGGRSVYTSNWVPVETLAETEKWRFLKTLAQLKDAPVPKLQPTTAMLLSTWDVICGYASSQAVYIPAHAKLCEDGKQVIDVLTDTFVLDNPRVLARYRKIVLPFNKVVPAKLIPLLKTNKARVVLERPDIAGTLDAYGHPTSSSLSVALGS